jgi:hypothetical protein
MHDGLASSPLPPRSTERRYGGAARFQPLEALAAYRAAVSP